VLLGALLRSSRRRLLAGDSSLVQAEDGSVVMAADGAEMLLEI
jgi:hypothetical protein